MFNFKHNFHIQNYLFQCLEDAEGHCDPDVPYLMWQILRYRSRLTIVIVMRLPQPKKKPAQP